MIGEEGKHRGRTRGHSPHDTRRVESAWGRRGHQEHLFHIHPAEDTLFGASEIKGSRNLDQTLGGGGRVGNWLGMKQTAAGS